MVKRHKKESAENLAAHRTALQRAKRSIKLLKKLIFMMKREFTFKETRQAASNLIEQTMVRGAFKALNKKIMKAKTLIDEEASY